MPQDAVAVIRAPQPRTAEEPTPEGAALAAGAAISTPDTKRATSRIARNLGALTGGQLVTWTMTLIWTLVVPRALGPVGLGFIVTAQSVSGILCIALSSGNRPYLVREMVTESSRAPKLIGTALVLRIGLVPLVGIAAVLWALLANYSSQAAVVLYLITAMTCLTLIAEPLQAVFQSIERMKYLAYADIINKSAQSLVGIALVILGFGAVGIAATMAVAAGVVVFLNLLWLRPFFHIDFGTTPTLVKDVARRSAPYWTFTLFGLIYMWIDTVMLSLMEGPRVVGWYGVPTQLFQTLMFLPIIVSTAWLPRLVSSFKVGKDHLITNGRTPLEFTLVVSIPIAVSLAIAAPLLINSIYGARYANAVPVLIVFAFCIPPTYVNIIQGSILLAAKRQSSWTLVMAGSAVINPLFNLVLIPLTQSRYHNGAIGAAVSMVLTELVTIVAGFVLIGRSVVRWTALRRCALSLVAGAGTVAVYLAAQPWGRFESVLAGMTALVGLTIVLRIPTAEEIALVKRGLMQVRRRGRPGSVGGL